MSEIEALQARVAAAQAQLGKAHDNRHEQSARLAELIDSVEKTLSAKQAEIAGYHDRIQALEQSNERLHGLLEGLLAVIEGTGTDRLSEAMQRLDTTFAALAGGTARTGAAAESAGTAPPEAGAADDAMPPAEDAALSGEIAEAGEIAETETPAEDLAALLDVDEGPAEDGPAPDETGDEMAMGAETEAAELPDTAAEDTAAEAADPVDATPEPEDVAAQAADDAETAMGELHGDRMEGAAEPAHDAMAHDAMAHDALAEEAMAEDTSGDELLAAPNDMAADDGPAMPDAGAIAEGDPEASTEPTDETAMQPLSGDPSRVKEIIERVSRLADEMADVINNGDEGTPVAEAEAGPETAPETDETDAVEPPAANVAS